MRVGLLFGIVVILDQITKMIIRHTMMIGQSISIFGHFLKITYVENPGIAFGIRVNNGSFFTILSILASLGVLIYLFAHRDEGMAVKGSLALILGGAFGNLVDRIFYKKVVDFIDVGVGNLRWPVFNLADSAVVIGVFLLFFSVFVFGKKNEKLQREGAKEVV